MPAGPEETFFQTHRAGIIVIWRRDGREWWRQHYVSVHGQEPPDGWWMPNDRTADGWQIAPGMMRAFGYLDDAVKRAYFDEMEARYRVEAGLPARGEGWVSETYLATCVQAVLPGYEVVREASPGWLGRQRLDVYVPALGFAIEYQGVQHYEPVGLFGGDESFADRQSKDEQKRAACALAGVILVEWRYDAPVSEDAVRERLSALGLMPRAG